LTARPFERVNHVFEAMTEVGTTGFRVITAWKAGRARA
jgi:hypothetical protein